MQRRYRQKKYHCGEYVEVAIYPVYTKAKGSGKRCKPTVCSEEKEAAIIDALKHFKLI